MLNIGFSEILVIVVVALIFVGPKKLPELMKKGGKYFVQMRRAAQDVRSAFDQVVREAEDEVRRDEILKLQKLLTQQEEEIKTRMGLLAQDPEGHHSHHDHGPRDHGTQTPEKSMERSDVYEAPIGSVSLNPLGSTMDAPYPKGGTDVVSDQPHKPTEKAEEGGVPQGEKKGTLT